VYYLKTLSNAERKYKPPVTYWSFIRFYCVLHVSTFVKGIIRPKQAAGNKNLPKAKLWLAACTDFLLFVCHNDTVSC